MEICDFDGFNIIFGIIVIVIFEQIKNGFQRVENWICTL